MLTFKIKVISFRYQIQGVILMTEKLINSKPNGVVALIIIELALVLGVFIFIMGAGSENIFGVIIGLLLILISALAHAGLSSQTSGSSGFNPLW